MSETTEVDNPQAPCIFCGHAAGEHDVEAECWVPRCPCGSGEDGDPQHAAAAVEVLRGETR